MISLLDANFLIALFDEGHIHHEVAHRWLEGERGGGWATCALTQNACIRILSQHSYSGKMPLPDAARRLRKATEAEDHQFWECRVEPCDPAIFDHHSILTSKHLTDLYLLALCVERGGRLVTFDQGIQLRPVPKAEAKHLLML